MSEIDYQIWDGMSLTKLVVPIQAVHVLAFSISDAFVNSWYLYEVFYKRSGFKVFHPSDFHCGRLHWILINSFLDGTCDHSILHMFLFTASALASLQIACRTNYAVGVSG